ncbi:SDR family NAD(P)-dependent oxidoreductase [Nocardioides terrisoli]|uniref:SDR family NAD(P)-dependent oxidoreductase n=1 Tax=Nocardioides terrisoli TaxID=3388267 RepID=UPI00287B8314|nr:SDR family NAD(P)-dependent oxidoreductase [Nocardioides marmorisolisilvae]
MGSLEGKVAVITASTRSIGLGIAAAYLREGAQVVISSRSEDKGKQALAELGGLNRAHFIAADATKREDVERLIDETVAHFGGLDIVVLNAGGCDQTAPVAEISDAEWQYELDWNLNHTFWGMRRAMRHMLPAGKGRIIAMSSIEGKLGKAGIPGYTSNKHAILGLVKSAAREVGTAGITVNAICPGIVLTDAFYDGGPVTIEAMGLPDLDALAAIFYKESALQRPITVDEVAAAAVFIAGDSASGITGVALNVDGGTSPY